MDIWETCDPWRFNILFCCMPLFLSSTTPIWTIDSRTSLTYLSDPRTPPLRISSFPVGSTNSKNDGDTDVYVAYPLPCRYLQHRSPQIILYCIIVFGWSEPIITEIEWNRYLSGIQPPFWGSFMTHLFSFYFRGTDWKNLSQRLTEICLSEVLSGFLFPTHLTEISTFCLTNFLFEFVRYKLIQGMRVIRFAIMFLAI
jgi:hypothetical protein